ncbi:MAG TPA: DUF2202 domain-containing protein [Chloroflexota bacterium]|nr:DUF2202 domain-containing protein [Chloroflexota bacterium]
MLRNKFIELFILLVALALVACSEAAELNPAANNPVANSSTAVNPISSALAQTAVNSLPAPVVQMQEEAQTQPLVDLGDTAVVAAQPILVAGELSEAEIAALNFMREEEKLAHDVYIVLFEVWGLPVLQNIAAGELNHTASVLRVLEQYGLPDPAAGNPAGVFHDPALQTMYTQMVAQGSQSLLEALRVGAAIEEVDILDLQARLTQTTNPAILRVYENLLAGSANHLRSFVSLIEQQTGVAYEPQYLTAVAYAEIIALAVGNGQNGQGAGGQGQGQGGQGQGQGGQGQGQGGQGQGQGGQGQGQGGQGQGNRGVGSGRGG